MSGGRGVRRGSCYRASALRAMSATAGVCRSLGAGLALVLIGCSGDVPTAVDGDAGPDDLWAPAARRLGIFLAEVHEATSVELESIPHEWQNQDLCRALDVTFGDELEEVQDSDGWVEVGGAFRYQNGQCNNLDETVVRDGRPAIVPQSFAFYEYTVVDTMTGAVYQSCGGASAGCETALARWFGPLVPDSDAWVLGHFDWAERGRIKLQIAHAFNDERQDVGR